MKLNKPILFLDILTDDNKIRQRINKEIYLNKSYSQAWLKRLRIKEEEMVTFYAHKYVPTKLSGYSAIIIGGSTLDPFKGTDKPWMLKVYKLINTAIETNIPLLGVCGGLQFTARALGCDVIKNPSGRRFGTYKINLTTEGEKSFLFKNISKPVFSVSHKCIGVFNKKNVNLQASNSASPYDALTIGNNVWLTQFHPEMSVAQLKRLIKSRKSLLLNEKFIASNKWSQFLNSIDKRADTCGEQFLNNFIEEIKKRSYPVAE